MHHPPHTRLFQIHHQIRLTRHLIRIIHTRKPLNLAPPRLRIHAPFIRPLTMLQTRRHMHKIKAPMLTHRLPRALPALLKRRNRPTDDRRPGFRQLGRHERDPLDVLVAIRAAESQLRAQLAAHRVT